MTEEHFRKGRTHTHAAFNMMVYSEEPIWPIPHIPALYDDGDYGGKIMWEKLGCNALYLFFFFFLKPNIIGIRLELF